MQYYAVGSCPKEGSHEPMRLASTTETLIKYVCTRCLTAHRGHNMYCKNSPLDYMACPVFVSRASGLARETIPVYFPTPSIWTPDSPRRVWGLDYSIVYSYLGICHVFVMRSSRSLTIILPGHTAVPTQCQHAYTKLPPRSNCF